MDRKEKIQAIREELKENGITNKQVSVTGKSSLYDDVINVSIKDLKVNYNLVKSISEKHEEIRYDEYNREILQGCNTYVNVSFNFSIVQEEKLKYMEKAKEIMEQGKEYTEGSLMTIAEKDNFAILYSPKRYNGNCEHIELSRKPDNWKKLNGYCFTKVERYIAHNEYAIAEALLMFACQYGIDVLEENITPEPPKPTKKAETKQEQPKQNNIIIVDFTSKATFATNTTNTEWQEEQATSKQLYALYCATKIKTTDLKISKGLASKLISASKAGQDIKTELKEYINNNSRIAK